MVLHVKGAPNTPLLAQGSLQGLRICVDPGHGGKETGAIGCSGIKEASINLGIGLKVERMLREMGAEVIMTRRNDIDVSLQDRVNTAVAARADLLLSIHGNSLPDGRNPWTEHGTSSYYYHPQSRGYANDVRAATVQTLGFPDYNTRWQNLALCRPTQMPACLVEVGFVINPDEYATMISTDGQEHAARGITNGVLNFLKVNLLSANSSAAGAVPADPN
jgi:N-acetylmuramoyl-L-alanine amidase